MAKADSIIRDPNVAVEFTRQIFPPEVQQSMVGRPDFEVFCEGVHGAVRGLYTAYEIGMLLCVAPRDIEQRGERIRGSLEKSNLPSPNFQATPIRLSKKGLLKG